MMLLAIIVNDIEYTECVMLQHILFGGEIKLEEVVSDLGSTLAWEHEHGVSGHSQGKVTAGWRYVPSLVHLNEEQKDLAFEVKCNAQAITLTQHFIPFLVHMKYTDAKFGNKKGCIIQVCDLLIITVVHVHNY